MKGDWIWESGKWIGFLLIFLRKTVNCAQ